MTKSKHTKRALLASSLSVLLCLAMLVGLTFAWFTDTASTSVNGVQAGTLDVQLLNAADENLEGQTLNFVKAAGAGNEPLLWEPGCTYNTQQFYIKNNGNLNLKFKFSVSGITGDAKLLEVLDFTAMADASWFKFNTGAVSITTSGEFDLLKGHDVYTLFYGTKHFDEYVLEPGEKAGPIMISGHMAESAGNEYQGLSIDGIAITVMATQATGEEDSYNGTYDGNAEYLHVANTAAELADILALVGSGETILLNSGVNLPILSVPNGLNGVTFVSNGADIGQIVIDGDGIDNVTFDGFNLVTTGSQASSPIWIDPDKSIQTLTFRNTTITGEADVKERTAIASGNAGATLVLENCRFINVGRPIYDAYKGYKELIIRNCEFNNASTGSGLSWAIAVYGSGEKKVTIDNCRFIGCKEGIMKTQGTKISAFTFTNNTMTDCAPHDPYGLFALNFTDDCVKSVSGNTADGAAFDGTPFGF